MLCHYYRLKQSYLVVLCCWAALIFMAADCSQAPTLRPTIKFGVILSGPENSTLPPLLLKLTSNKNKSHKLKQHQPQTTSTTTSTTTINTLLETYTPPSLQDISEFELLHGDSNTLYNSYPTDHPTETQSHNVVKAWVREENGETYTVEIEDDSDYETTSTSRTTTTTTTAAPLITKKTKPRRTKQRKTTTTTTTVPTQEEEGKEEREDKKDTGPRAIASISDYEQPQIDTYWYKGSDGRFLSRQASGGASSLSSINLATPVKALALLLGIIYFL